MKISIETPLSIITGPGLTAAEKITLSVIVALAARSDFSIEHDNEFFVGINVCKSDRTASRIIRKLKELEYITIRHKYVGPKKIRVISLDLTAFKAYEDAIENIQEMSRPYNPEKD